MLPTRKNPHLSHYDYSQNGCYFITLCTEKRKMLLGRISAGMMEMSFLGELADKELSVLGRFFEDIAISEKVIMPNHIHFIVRILQSGSHSPLSIGRFVNLYKGRVSRKAGYALWQRGYYEHIIRTPDDYTRAAQYIRNNPAQWSLDQYNRQEEMTAQRNQGRIL